MNNNIYIDEFLLYISILISHVFIIFIIYFIHRKFRKKWRVNASYKYIDKIKGITGDNEFPRTLAYLRKIDPFIYEEMILSAMEIQGIKIYRNKKYTGDGGIDGKFKFNGKICLVQAKRYKNHINKKHVLEFNALVNQAKTKGLFIHTGRTGKGSRNAIDENLTFVSGNNMILFLKNKKDIKTLIH
jgi:restriction system protein